METLIDFAGLIGAVWVAGFFVFMLHMKIYHPSDYAGRHRPDNIERVSPDYIPAGNMDDDGKPLVRYTALWRARMHNTSKTLRVPLWRLEECYQEHLARRLSNYKWVTVPTNEWPTAWRIAR